MILLCKKNTVAKCKEIETGRNLAESSEGGHGIQKDSFANDDDEQKTLQISSYIYEVIIIHYVTKTGWEGVWIKFISLSIGTS
jgi:hypothetical protein